ncbi:MAG TPA: hypothetical protein VJU15_07690, partial [Gemmatimonadales bacterium]|nr:hypothetical protein [Gemmatimonadales bacterium]
GDRDGGGFLGLAARTGQTFAQAGISAEGRGLFQVFAPGGASIAVMGQGGPGNAGIFQVANAGGVKATLTTAEGGGGLFQLVSTTGQVTVEAGTLQSGKGHVRVGPFWKCAAVHPATPAMSIGHEDCLVGSLDAK